MNQDFSEFIKSVKKVSGPRKHKVKQSSGMKDAFLHYRKTRPKDNEFVLSEKQYSSIINEMDLLWCDLLLQKGSMVLPEGLGGVKIVKVKSDAYIDSTGKLKITRPVNINETLKLWYEDKESFENKTLVRFEEDYSYRIVFSRGKALFKNSTYFRIQFNRSLKQRLSNLIREGKFDTFEKYRT